MGSLESVTGVTVWVSCTYPSEWICGGKVPDLVYFLCCPRRAQLIREDGWRAASGLETRVSSVWSSSMVWSFQSRLLGSHCLSRLKHPRQTLA